MAGEIMAVLDGSPAQELGVKPGDRLLSINGRPVRDLIDYHYLCDDDPLTIEIAKASGERLLYEIEGLEPGEDLGLQFAANVFDGIRPCRNHCLFCFIDQLQPAPRRSLLLKDDDYRMSFLEGNYITGTNLREEDFARIAELHLSPLYVSVHATDEALRTRMLGCKKAAPALPLLERLIACGARVHTQIVLCPGVNDGAYLERTVADLTALHPGVASIAVVPVGLTRFQRNPMLRPFTRAEARTLIEWLEAQQAELLRRQGTRLVFASDELYIQAGLPFPPAAHYEDFEQLENGVGMAAHFLQQWQSLCARDALPARYAGPRTAILTGQSGYAVLNQLEPTLRRVSNGAIEIVPVTNSFYGPQTTVTGLLTGRCLLDAQTAGQYERILICANMLKFDEDIFLDDLTLEQVTAQLKTPVQVVANDAWQLIDALFENKE